MSKALIIIDIQNDYFENGAMELVGSLPASENAKLILSKFRKENLPIVHIQHLAVAPGAEFFFTRNQRTRNSRKCKTIG